MELSSHTLEYAEYLLESIRQVPFKLLEPMTNTQKVKSIHQKLVALQIEECLQITGDETMTLQGDLLQTLVKKEKLSTVVVNLYPGSEGYSIMLRGKAGTNDTETIKLPYEESEILDYIDNAELPPMFIELLEKAQVNVFYSGCVIVELRDYRRSTTGTYDAQYILLKPTPQTLLCDINTLTNDGHIWTQDDQFHLESQLLLSTQEPLCLDPSPVVMYVTNRLEYERSKFNTPLLKRSIKKYSQAAINRKRKFSQAAAPKELSLFDFIHQKKDRGKPNTTLHSKINKTGVDLLKQKPVSLCAPVSVDVDKYATIIEKTKLTTDNSLTFVEEYVLERERGHIKPHQTKSIYTKVSVYQRPSDDYYFGELYIDHDYVDGSCKGKSCQFPFGSKSNVDKYIQQLIEIFTEGGRLFARVSHTKKGRPCEVSFAHSNSLVASSSVSLTSAESLLLGQPTGQTVGQVAHSGHYPAPTNAVQMEAGGGTMGLKPLQLSSPTTIPGPTVISPHTPTTYVNEMSRMLDSGVQGDNRIVEISRQRSAGGASLLTSSFNMAQSQDVQSQNTIHKLTNQSYATKQRALSKGIGQISSVSSSPAVTPTSAGPEDGQCYTLMSPPGISTTSVTAGNVANINIANITGLSPSMNLHNLAQLQGMNITGIHGLQNVQVSLSGLPVAGGQLTLPISMVTASQPQSILANPGSVLVSSVPCDASTKSLSTVTIDSNDISQPTSVVPVSSQAYITMATAVTCVGSYATLATSITPTASTSTTASSPSTIFSLPISMTTGLNQLVPAGMKAAGGTNIRTAQTLFQLPGHHGLQLLSVQQKGQIQSLATKPPPPPPLIAVTSGSAPFSGQASPTNLPTIISNLPPPQYQPAMESARLVDNTAAAVKHHCLTPQHTSLSQTLPQQKQLGNLTHTGLGQSRAVLSHHGSASFNQTLAGINQNLSGLPQSVTGINRTISGLQQNIPRLPSSLAGLSANISGISQNITVGLSQTPGLPNQLTMGLKPGQTGLTHQQLMQLATVNPQNLTPQQMHTQLAIQREFQLRQTNQAGAALNAPQQQSVASTSKYKRGKQMPATPPKAP